MSVSVIRHIEIKVPYIDGYVNKIEDLKNIEEVFDGKVVKVWEDKETPYHVYHGEEEDSDGGEYPAYWEPKKDTEINWELLTWWSDSKRGYSSEQDKKVKISDRLTLKKHEWWSNNGGPIRDVYLNDAGWSDVKVPFVKRGFPTDISQEAKKCVDVDNEWSYNRTWVLLSEWKQLLEQEEERLKNKLINIINEKNFKEINSKLDSLLKRENLTVPKKNEDDEEYEDTPDQKMSYFFDEDIYDYKSIMNEISYIEFIVDEVYGYVPEENIRIIYYFCH